MPTSTAVLERVVHPMGAAKFVTECWGLKPYDFRRAAPAYFAELMSVADVDRILATMPLRYPDVRVTKLGEHIRVEDYTRLAGGRDATFGQVVDTESALRFYHAGATLVLTRANRYWPPLAELCCDLANLFKMDCRANVYLTPAGGQAFPAHRDPHDVFVLQLSGSKRWQVHDIGEQPPTGSKAPIDMDGAGHSQSDRVNDSPLLLDIELQAGESLYVPRGFVHEVWTSAERSLHVTVSLHPFVYLDLFHELVRRCALDDRFQEAIPLSDVVARNRATANWQQQFQELVGNVCQSSEVTEIAELMFDAVVLQSQPPSAGRLLDFGDTDGVSLATRLRIRPGIRWSLKRRDQETMLLLSGGKLLRLPLPDADQILRFVTNADTFSAEEIPGTTGAEKKLTLVKEWIKEGFLVTA